MNKNFLVDSNFLLDNFFSRTIGALHFGGRVMIIDTNAAIEGLKSNCKLKSGLINQTVNFFRTRHIV